MTSGLTRPSAVGPHPLNAACSPEEFTAPTANMPLASAGAVIKCHGELPLFPALVTHKIPFSAAHEVAREMRVVMPFRSS